MRSSRARPLRLLVTPRLQTADCVLGGEGHVYSQALPFQELTIDRDELAVVVDDQDRSRHRRGLDRVPDQVDDGQHQPVTWSAELHRCLRDLEHDSLASLDPLQRFADDGREIAGGRWFVGQLGGYDELIDEVEHSNHAAPR